MWSLKTQDHKKSRQCLNLLTGWLIKVYSANKGQNSQMIRVDFKRFLNLVILDKEMVLDLKKKDNILRNIEDLSNKSKSMKNGVESKETIKERSKREKIT